MAWSWDFALQVFRSLGGTANNIARKEGASGRGIVAADPGKHVLLRAPANLLFPLSDVEIAGDRLKLKDSAKVGKAERTFFENYYDAISWGGGGHAESAAFIAGLDALPADVKHLLAANFSLEGLLEGSDQRVAQWFLRNRLFGCRGVAVLAPFLELVNHDSNAAPFSDENGLTIGGRFADEVLVLRSKAGPFGAFLRFGFASPERAAFSLPMEFKTDTGCEVTIEQNINMNSTLGSVPVPEFEQNGGAVRFSCLMIGNSGFPRLSRGIFYRIMREAGETNPEQVFDNILHRNRLTFLKLLEVLEYQEGGLVAELRKVVRYQLEAMSWCIGTRDL
jgi:hypothetical protein